MPASYQGKGRERGMARLKKPNEQNADSLGNLLYTKELSRKFPRHWGKISWLGIGLALLDLAIFCSAQCTYPYVWLARQSFQRWSNLRRKGFGEKVFLEVGTKDISRAKERGRDEATTLKSVSWINAKDYREKKKTQGKSEVAFFSTLANPSRSTERHKTFHFHLTLSLIVELQLDALERGKIFVEHCILYIVNFL